MIRLLGKWAVARIKVNIRSASFWLMTILMALALILTRRVIGEYSADTRVLLYVADEGASVSAADGLSGGVTSAQAEGVSAGEWCVAYMCDHTPDGFVYERVYSEDELTDRVSTGDASCGVVFGDGPEVTIYQTAGSVDGYVVREMVYPVLAEYMSAVKLSEYVSSLYPALSEDVISGRADEAAEYVKDSYRSHMDQLELELFEVRDICADQSIGLSADDEMSGEGSVTGYEERTRRLERLVFGLILLLLCGMCLYDTSRTDRAFYSAFPSGKRIILAGAQIVITVVMSASFAAALSYVIRA